MAIVPSGRFRLMYAQTMGQDDPENNGVGAGAAPPGAAPQQRNDVEQQQIGATPGAATQEAPSEQEQNPQMGENPAEGGMLQPEEAAQKTQKAATTLKAYVYHVLEEVGLHPRQLEDVDKQIFKQEIDFDTHTITGHYMIPTFTAKGPIDENKAMQIAQNIKQKFGLSQKMSLEGRNWKVTFRSAPKATLQHGGSSFDELSSGGAGGNAGNAANLQRGNSGQKQAAFTMGEILTARKDDLYETMRKIAKGKN